MPRLLSGPAAAAASHPPRHICHRHCPNNACAATTNARAPLRTLHILVPGNSNFDCGKRDPSLRCAIKLATLGQARARTATQPNTCSPYAPQTHSGSPVQQHHQAMYKCKDSRQPRGKARQPRGKAARPWLLCPHASPRPPVHAAPQTTRRRGLRPQPWLLPHAAASNRFLVHTAPRPLPYCLSLVARDIDASACTSFSEEARPAASSSRPAMPSASSNAAALAITAAVSTCASVWGGGGGCGAWIEERRVVGHHILTHSRSHAHARTRTCTCTHAHTHTHTHTHTHRRSHAHAHAHACTHTHTLHTHTHTHTDFNNK